MKIGLERLPQGLKPSRFCGLFGTTKQLAEKNQTTAEFVERSYAEAKALIDSGLFAARLKSCPVTKRVRKRVFQQAVKSCPVTKRVRKRVFQQAVKSCPVTKRVSTSF